MKLRTPSPAIGLVIALGSAAAGCGSDELFTLEIGANERLIDTAAASRLANPDRGMELPLVVGDLDGDGIDDAIVRSNFTAPGPAGKIVYGGALHVLYGGSGVTGAIDLASLPALTQIGAPVLVPPAASVVAVGDVDGDGLADVLVSIDTMFGCSEPQSPWITDGPALGGAYLIYGSTTRLSGSHLMSDVAVHLSDPTTCGHWNIVAGLGDIDGDGMADFAISTESTVFGELSKVFVFYGRGQRLSGTVDLAATADAVITEPGAPQGLGSGDAYRVGDVDGDGLSDFIVRLPLNGQTLDARLVRGSAHRLAGAVALGDIGHTQLPGDEFCFWNTAPFAVALGDLDGDGADDFSLVNCQRGQNFVYGPVVHRVFYGHKGELPAQLGAADAAATIDPVVGPWSSQLLAGDLDGDGVPDLVLADVNLHDGNGGVHVMKGRHERLSGAIDPSSPLFITYVGQPQRVPNCDGKDCFLPERVGSGIDLGDLTGDHHPDLLIGAASDDYEIVPGPGTAMGHTYVLSSPVIPKP